MRVDERLLKYVSYWTTSSEDSDTIPSTDRQFNLAKELEKELLDLGLQKVTLTDHCYIYGLIPATPGYEDKKAVGFISHMDTAPDFSGENVKPQIIPDYNGEDVILKGTGDVLKTSDFPELKTLKGRTLITTDGTTLLGADDKAGVAEIMTAAEQLISSDIPHGDIWIGFTPDEEVGRGADLFDLDYFKADFAYTVDGDYEGEVAYENFNAASAVFAVKGVNVHPGEAKDIMVNAALVACEIQSQLPPMETPAHTEGREGFYHLTDMSGDVAAATLSYIIRDHDKVMFETRQKKMQEIADSMNQKYGVGTVTLTICSCQVRNKKKLIFFINGEPLARFPMLLLYNFVFSLLLLIIPSSSLKVIKVPSDFNMLIIIHQHIINEISDYFFIKLIQLTKLC